MPTSPARKAAQSVLAALPVIMRTVGRSVRESGGEVSPQQHRVLALLSRSPRTLGEVARIQGVTPATATTMITTLENRGWVRREADAEDRRRVVVSVTGAGRTAFAVTQEVVERAIAELLEPLDAEELEQVAHGFESVRILGSSEPSPAGG